MKELLSTVLHSSLPTAIMSSDQLIFMGYSDNCFFLNWWASCGRQLTEHVLHLPSTEALLFINFFYHCHCIKKIVLYLRVLQQHSFVKLLKASQHLVQPQLLRYSNSKFLALFVAEPGRCFGS